MYNMLSTTTDFLQKHGIDFFLFTGTLLGAYREKDILQSDTDIDLVVDRRGRDLLVKQTEIPYSWYLESSRDPKNSLLRGCQNFTDPGHNPLRSLSKSQVYAIPKLGWGDQPSIYMDVYPLESFSLVRKIKKMMGPKYDFKPYESVIVRGKWFPVPQDPKGVLEKLYGGNWMTPSNVHATADLRSGLSLDFLMTAAAVVAAAAAYVAYVTRPKSKGRQKSQPDPPVRTLH